MILVAIILALSVDPDYGEMAPAWSRVGTHIPATRNPYLADLFTGPQGGEYWLTPSGRKHYTHHRKGEK